MNQIFSDEVLAGNGKVSSRKLHPRIVLPTSSVKLDYEKLVNNLPDLDAPSLFGLPENVETIIRLEQSKRLVQLLSSSSLIQEKISDDVKRSHLIEAVEKHLRHLKGSLGDQHVMYTDEQWKNYRHNDFAFGCDLVRRIMTDFESCLSWAKSSTALSGDLVNLVNSIVSQKTPLSWQILWGYDDDSIHNFIAAISHRLHAYQARDGDLHDIDLTTLFRPSKMLNMFRQESARKYKTSMTDLELASSWDAPRNENVLIIKACGIKVCGAVLMNGSLSEVATSSPTLSNCPPCYLFWRKQVKDKHSMALPLYANQSRDKTICTLDVSCNASERSKWRLAGTCFCL